MPPSPGDDLHHDGACAGEHVPERRLRATAVGVSPRPRPSQPELGHRIGCGGACSPDGGTGGAACTNSGPGPPPAACRRRPAPPNLSWVTNKRADGRGAARRDVPGGQLNRAGDTRREPGSGTAGQRRSVPPWHHLPRTPEHQLRLRITANGVLAPSGASQPELGHQRSERQTGQPGRRRTGFRAGDGRGNWAGDGRGNWAGRRAEEWEGDAGRRNGRATQGGGMGGRRRVGRCAPSTWPPNASC